ncbi:MAG: hypothetical protein P8101_14055, partial [Candidatus Thiodiazotropha sp.]
MSKRTGLCRNCLIIGLILSQFCLCGWVHADLVRIGVLSHRGEQITHRMWVPTAEYLDASIPGYHFVIRPLTFDEVDPAVEAGKVDFVLVNP